MVKTIERPEADAHEFRVSCERAAAPDWRHHLPVLKGNEVVLRELRASDASSLASVLTTEEVARFIWQPPATNDAFEEFIARSNRQRAAGTSACFAITLKNLDTAIGIFQVRETAPNFGTAEWGFAIGSSFWGTGVFEEGARLVLQFAFETLHVHRLEARVAVRNGRGQGALRKMGAVQEGVLRKSLLRDGQYFDQALFTILAEEWRSSHKTVRAGYALHVH